jgi:two-component system response regulator FixJ
MCRRWWFGLALTLLAAQVAAATEEAAAPGPLAEIAIGVLAVLDDADTERQWQPLFDSLAAALPDQRLVLRPLDPAQMEEALRQRALAFVITNPGHSVLFMLKGCGFTALGHASAEAFLDASPALPPQGGCLLLDIRMPRMSGLELQRRLADAGSAFPIVFMTGHGDVEQAVQAMKGGALDFLPKPFREQALLDSVNRAVEASVERQRLRTRRHEALAQLERPSPREREVARLLALGLSNKEVARELDISDHTVHVHRQRITDKTGRGHAADLAHMLRRADHGGAGPALRA